MKNKIIITIMAVLIFVSAFNVQRVSAGFYGSLNNWTYVAVGRYAGNHSKYSICYWNVGSVWNWSDGFHRFTNSYTLVARYDGGPALEYSSMSEAIAAARSFLSGSQNIGSSGGSSNFDMVVPIKGAQGCTTNTPKEAFYSNADSYIDSITPKWYEKMWDDFGNFLGATGEGIVDFFGNIIDAVFGDDSEGGPISHAVTIRNPTLAPTPTPISYTTVVIPKTDVTTGDTYYETNYYYVNPSGTPIITGSPPVNSPTNNGGCNGGTEYSPMNGQPYSIPKLDWLSSVDIDGTGYDGIDSIGDGMASIDEIGSEYTDGMSAVQDATGTIPTDWLLLIGIVAAIPLLAGIVSRFLGG